MTCIKLVVLVSAVMVLSITPAMCQVSFSQGGSTAEPLSVDRTITYNIPITNDKSSTLSYSIDLKVGPDKDNTSIYLEQTKSDIFVDPHQTKPVTFSVNFHDSKIDQGEFNQWLKDKNDARIWEKSWYHAEITEFRDLLETLEDYNGRPRLMKTFFEYSNEGVSPKQGTDKNLYSYKVTIVGSYKDNITLQVSPSKNGPWTDFDTLEYANPGVPQTLSWINKSLGFDFNAAHYRFKGIKPSNTFDGPFWPVTVDYRNQSLTPMRGLSSTPFNYSIVVNSSKKINVGLNVFDIVTKTYKLAGMQSYTNVSEWQKLEWQNVDLGAISGSEGRSNYYFGFYYVGSEAPFLTTYDRFKKYYPGPDIVQVIFKNASVTPANGSALMPYTYSVDVETALSNVTVQLKTSDPGPIEWVTWHEIPYDGSNKTLIWKNVKLEGEAGGQAIYKFVCGQSESDIYKGPMIGSMKITSYVQPYNGSLYITDKTPTGIDQVYSFNYVAEIIPFQNESSMVISLEILDPEANSWLTAGSQTWKPGQKWLNYTVNFAKLPFLRPFLNETRYRYTAGGLVLNESKKGPNILVNFMKESFEDLQNGTLRYRVEVRSAIKLPIDIIYTDDGLTWQPYNKKQNCTGDRQWQLISWKARKFQKLEFVADVGQ